MNFKFEKQLHENDCGPTALAMVIQYHNKKPNLNLLREDCELSKEGVNLYLFCEKDEEKFRVQLVMLLEKRLPGRMTEMEINSCFNWVREAVKK
jgi:ABC-type bacteriocin/lantibiotic exporter with double-glycine peptidase domain